MSVALYLLDTDICSYLMKRTHPQLIERVRLFAPGHLKVSGVTVFELTFGAHRSPRCGEILRVIAAFLENVEVLPFDRAASVAAGRARAELAASGQPIGAYDVLIAGHARALGATLVTHNVREFSRVPGLTVEDWSVE